VTALHGHLDTGDVASRRFEALARHCTDVVSVLDLATHRWTYVSPSIVRQTGYAAEEVIGQRVGAILAPAHALDGLRHTQRERIAALEAGDESRRVEVSEITLLHRSGDPMRCEVTTILVTDEADRCVEMVCVAQDVLAQRLAAEEVRASDVRFRSLVEQMPIGVLYQDSLGRIIMSNPAARQMTGLGDDAVTIGDIDLWHETGTSFTPEETPGRRAIESGEIVRDVLMGIDVPGHDGRRWISVTSVPQNLAADGRPASRGSAEFESGAVEIFTILVDVTAERAATEESRLKEAAMASASTGIAIADLDDRWVYVNDALLTMWHLDSVEHAFALHQQDYWLMPPTDARRAILGGETWRGELVARRLDGSTFEADVSVSPVFDDTGRLVRTMQSINDISERNHLQREIAATAARLERAQEIAHIGSWEMDIATREMVWSAETHRIGGFDLGTPATYRIFLSRVHPDDRAQTDLAFHRAVEQLVDFEVEHRLLLPDGTVKWLHHHGTPHVMGGSVRMGGTVHDITERRRAAEAERLVEEKEHAEEANRAKSAFLASMSHEIRTPMTSVLGFTQVLLDDTTLDERQRGYLGLIERSGEHLLRLIDDILQMSTIEAGRVVLQPVEVDLDGVLADLGAIFEMRLADKGVAFVLRRAAQVPRVVRADALRLRQVLINLVGNAAKFTESGSVAVRIDTGADVSTDNDETDNDDTDDESTVQRHRSSIVFSVSDTGPGIAADSLERVFGRFEQTDLGRVTAGGTGLGLAISRGLVEAMGGRIDLSSRLGSGTTFSVVIPVEEVEVPTQVDDTGTLPRPDLPTSLRILVADDAPENRMVLRAMLGAAGHEVAEAVDGQEAIDLFDAFQPDLVIMDVQMPVMDGLEAIRRIRSRPDGSAVPIVAATANVFDDDRQHVLDVGGDGFLPKPFTKGQLLRVIAEHVDRRSGR
jgi:PAS domain S-box-containing protein